MLKIPEVIFIDDIAGTGGILFRLRIIVFGIPLSLMQFRIRIAVCGVRCAVRRPPPSI